MRAVRCARGQPITASRVCRSIVSSVRRRQGVQRRTWCLSSPTGPLSTTDGSAARRGAVCWAGPFPRPPAGPDVPAFQASRLSSDHAVNMSAVGSHGCGRDSRSRSPGSWGRRLITAVAHGVGSDASSSASERTWWTCTSSVCLQSSHLPARSRPISSLRGWAVRRGSWS